MHTSIGSYEGGKSFFRHNTNICLVRVKEFSRRRHLHCSKGPIRYFYKGSFIFLKRTRKEITSDDNNSSNNSERRTFFFFITVEDITIVISEFHLQCVIKNYTYYREDTTLQNI